MRPSNGGRRRGTWYNHALVVVGRHNREAAGGHQPALNRIATVSLLTAGTTGARLRVTFVTETSGGLASAPTLIGAGAATYALRRLYKHQMQGRERKVGSQGGAGREYW